MTLYAETGYSQKERVHLSVDNIKIADVLKEIEQQTNYLFFYNHAEIGSEKFVSLNADMPINQLLDNIFKDTDVKYTVLDKHIVLTTNPELNKISTVIQGITITGIVTDEYGEPMPGASVLLKGITQGTVTDSNGAYSLQVPDGNATLVFSFIGFTTQEILVGALRNINVTMSEDARQIEEVVVIGYGARSKKDLTGAVSQISSDEITRQVALSPEFAMQGKMAGVFVSNTGSSPVARPTIRIRGVTTLGFNDPLYVIDGVPLTEGGAGGDQGRTGDLRGDVNVFAMINPNDIESISILKDASATAIYGVRASNGVILITTKRGAEGKAKVNLTASYGIQNIFKRYDMVSQQEYVDMTLEAINNNSSYNKDYWFPLYDKNSPEYMGNKPTYSKDWLDAGLMKNAGIQDYNLSVTGGTKMTNYAVGAGFSKQDEAIYKSTFDRYSFFLNSDHKLTNWLKVGESYRFVYTNYDRPNESANFRSISMMIPWQPLYDASDPTGWAKPCREFIGFDGNNTFRPYGYGPASINNIFAMAEYGGYQRNMMRNLGTFYAEIMPLKGLRLRGTYSFDYYTNTREEYFEPERNLYSIAQGVIVEGYGNTYNRRLNENINTVKEFLIGYNNKFGNHSVDVILNYMAQQIKWNNTQNAIDQNSPIKSWEQRYIDEGWERSDKGLFYVRDFSALIGYMGRISYNYSQKYYLDATIRRDGTSKFGPGYKWGTFPSFAAAWRISSENFMQNFSWMNDLKIRGGWGQTGNQETENFAFLSLMNLAPKAAFGVNGEGDGTIYPAAALANYAIKDMSWETVSTFSLGFDLIALQNRLSLTAEYYSRNTDGILQSITLPWTLGLTGSPKINLAKVNNRGFEFQVGYNDRFGEIGVHATANLTTVRNRVSDLYRGQRQGSDDTRIQSGYSMNYYYGYKTAGIFQTAPEVEAWKASGVDDVGNMSQKAPGDVIFVDMNGPPKDGSGDLENKAPDKLINDYDRTYIGKSIPGYYYGLTVGADYKNWDIVLSFRGVGDVQNVSSLGYNSISGGGQNFVTDYRKRWTPDNPSSKIPRAIQNDPSGNNRFSDRHIHNAGFFRFQNFQIGYNFKSDFIQQIGISNLRCYISGANLFVVSPYPDLDPENITTPTVFTFGVNLSF